MTAAEMTPPGLSDAEHAAQLRRAVIASTVGTVIEAYDFLLYGLVAPLAFSKLYFPASDPLVGTLRPLRSTPLASSAVQSARRFSAITATASVAR
jgi:hypothetical protein